jgi:hypothetical protein
MRYLVSPEFSRKLMESSQDILADVRGALERIETRSKEELLSSKRMIPLTLGSDLFAYRIGNVRIFLSFSSDEEGEYALIADMAANETPSISDEVSGRLYPKPDPKRDANLNPKLNSQINPKFNSQINPKFNSQINPKFNSQINPKFNSQINPKFNSQINPKFNSQISPKFNSSLNPKFNWSINARRNRSLATYFIFNLSADAQGYIVTANEHVWLVFDANAQWEKYAVRHPNDGFVVFRPDGEWIEHWESNGRHGWNVFTIDNEWTGFII